MILWPVRMGIKIKENLYYGSRLEYLSFGAKIAFMGAVYWELWSILCDPVFLMNFWTV